MLPKIVVTGGCGYIGSHTIIELIESGRYDVISVDSCVRSTPETMDRVANITGVQVRNYQLDICDKEAFFKVFEENPDVVGQGEVSSIESGVVSGIVFEIEGYLNLHPENIAVFTDGDANYFAKRMKSSIFVICNLVLMGLALIADEYVQKIG